MKVCSISRVSGKGGYRYESRESIFEEKYKVEHKERAKRREEQENPELQQKKIEIFIKQQARFDSIRQYF